MTKTRKALKGGYGSVHFKDGKAIKRPLRHFDFSMNRECIAYARMEETADLCVPRLFHYVMVCDKQLGLPFVNELVFEDAGMALDDWLMTEWFFDPVIVLLHPLLSALKRLKNLGIVHADLHPGNVCVRCDADGRLTAQLIDFGNSIVLKDTEWWAPGGIDVWVDPRTGLPSDQDNPPLSEAGEAELIHICNLPLFRDPLALAATVVTHETTFPKGLTIGHVDDVYALGMCVTQMLTMFHDVPWHEWRRLNTLRSSKKANDRFHVEKILLGQILQHNPAWDPAAFLDLHLRFHPLSCDPKDARAMEAAARAIEIHLWGVATLYPRFFEDLVEVYDKRTSHLVRACIQPDRHRRYALSDVKYKRGYRWGRRQQQQQKQREIASMVTQSKGVIHVSLGRCWIMTGIVRNGRMVWWNAASEMLTTTRNRKKAMIRSALEKFINKVTEMAPALESQPCASWPFDLPYQRKAWLKTLVLHDLAMIDTERDPAPRSIDTNEPVK